MNLSRTQIAFFGCRNAGKSSLINAVTAQALAVVSETPGTTTDPVKKTMELLPLGPVMLIDTPGIDDTGTLGALRVEKTREVLRQADVAVLVTDAARPLTKADEALIEIFQERQIPYLIAMNKADLFPGLPEQTEENRLFVSAKALTGIEALKERLAVLGAKTSEPPLARDLVSPGDAVILVTPIDSAAPKGRLILPQQQVIRDLLEVGALPFVCRETELSAALAKLKEPPALVITDSQAFGPVAALLPEEIPLTSFSILMARMKGNLSAAVEGVKALDHLKDGDTVLISEGCTHHRQCKDIGSVKLPAMLRKFTGKELQIRLTSGGEFPETLDQIALVIHCGACMLNGREARWRYETAHMQQVPVTNYGIAISYMKGILSRAIRPILAIPSDGR